MTHSKSRIVAALVLMFIGGFFIGRASRSTEMRQRLQTEAPQTNNDSQRVAAAAEYTAGTQRLIELSQQAIAAWETRAKTCEEKFKVITVLDEYRPAVSVPVLHGAFTVQLGSTGNPAGGLAPAWVIPAQVEPYSALPGAMYRWIDGKSGEARGSFAAKVPE